MATFVVCLKCGNVHETTGADQLPKGWQRSHADLYCANCADTSVLDVGAAGNVLVEQVISIDEDYCEVCKGPCQGH
jgi:hypothetical protein